MSLVSRRVTEPLLRGEDVRSGQMPPDLLTDKIGGPLPAAVLRDRLADAGDQAAGTARAEQLRLGRRRERWWA
jgi:hypothetical protein